MMSLGGSPKKKIARYTPRETVAIKSITAAINAYLVGHKNNRIMLQSFNEEQVGTLFLTTVQNPSFITGNTVELFLPSTRNDVDGATLGLYMTFTLDSSGNVVSVHAQPGREPY